MHYSLGEEYFFTTSSTLFGGFCYDYGVYLISFIFLPLGERMGPCLYLLLYFFGDIGNWTSFNYWIFPSTITTGTYDMCDH
jgi:hypothetical protein